MKGKNKFLKISLTAAVMLLGILFVAIFGGPELLKAYIRVGIGGCDKIPILCMMPREQAISAEPDPDFLGQLVRYKFPKITALLPKGFNVVHERIKKVYYKRQKRTGNKPVIYLLYQKPDYFVKLFPNLRKQGVGDDYEFLRRTMYADINAIKTITDAFFVIMKGIFVPDIGEQADAKMMKFTVRDKRGFINFNLTGKGNYFDCNVFDARGDYFKIYIKDINARLNLSNVLTIISAIEGAE
ncbi:MAG: hypothetical protein Q8N85_03380 [Candidatus Omnitrophota bacterium]|nr:hypothetical protein [Candidatus Omnitrophota bacterium]